MMKFENAPEEIGTYRSPTVGEALRAGIAKRWPKENIEAIPVTREGLTMYDLIAKTDPLTAAEMRAFCQGFFTAVNGPQE